MMAVGKVTFVGAGPGDPELITLKGWRALQVADAVLYDSLIDPRLLDGIRAECIYVGKRCGRHAMPQERINELLAGQALSGRHVVRVKGGDPVVLGRLGEEMLHLAALGIPYELVPGVTSATAAPAYAGIPVTHRGIADSFTVLTAHRRMDELDFSVPPYYPRTTIVLLMALTTVADWRGQLLRANYPAHLPVAFVSDGCSARQQVLVTTLGDALHDVQGGRLVSPTLAVVGWVVALRERLRWFEPSADVPLSGAERVAAVTRHAT